jgi:hypothetical protein
MSVCNIVRNRSCVRTGFNSCLVPGEHAETQAQFRISGEFEMKLYSVRKRGGQWSVSSLETIVLNFDSYDEAIGTAQSAAEVMVTRSSAQPDAPSEYVVARVGGRAWRLPRRAM